MGACRASKPAPQVIDADDLVFQLKMQAKHLHHISRRSERESQENIKKAKMALTKNNEEGAVLYINNSINKRKEAMNFLRTAHRLEAITTQVRSNSNNGKLLDQLRTLTPFLKQQADIQGVHYVKI